MKRPGRAGLRCGATQWVWLAGLRPRQAAFWTNPSATGLLALNKIRIEWHYDPPDFLEGRIEIPTPEANLTLDSGQATAELECAEESPPRDLVERLESSLRNVLRARQLVHHRVFELKPGHATIRVDEAGHRHISMAVGAAVCISTAFAADIVVRGADGKVKRDTRAERIAEQTALVRQVQAAATQSSLVTRLLESYSEAVAHPEDELVHLYEVRDAVADHFGGKDKAMKTLNLSLDEWQALGHLANATPIKEGRHRGRHPELRPATSAELENARAAVRSIILAVSERAV